MSKKKHLKRINKSDYSRVLLTDTLPYETPIVFSNDGLYSRIREIDSTHPIQRTLIRQLVCGEGEKRDDATVPYVYKIRKDSNELRRLALVHPRSQWRIKEFYQKYEHLIIYHCAQSPASIRSPKKISGSFFFKSSMENLNQYKDTSIPTLPTEEYTKNSPAFFAYRGFNRLYKFFESPDYLELEKQFGYMKTLDVSKCFDSIYTHTLSYAVKDKAFTKEHVKVGSTFAQEFDRLMQRANYNETNGIVIGPEVSRIFAEIIFQDVDVRTILGLRKLKYEFGEDYAFRRYVDDVFIFARSAEAALTVYETYADVLTSFNLQANVSKSISLERPFVTKKSRLIHAVSVETNLFLAKFLRSDPKNSEILVPLETRSVWRLTRSFIESIKTICSHNDSNYDEIAPYLIAVLAERIKKIAATRSAKKPSAKIHYYRDALCVLLDVIYFLYEVSPSVGASYKLCTAVIVATRFARKHLSEIESSIAQRIFQLTESLLRGHYFDDRQKSVSGFIRLEKLNVMLAARELGEY